MIDEEVTIEETFHSSNISKRVLTRFKNVNKGSETDTDSDDWEAKVGALTGCKELGQDSVSRIDQKLT